MKSLVVSVTLGLLLAGCGGGADAPGLAAPTATAPALSVTDTDPGSRPDSTLVYPDLGCDYLPHCYGEWAREALARCAEDTLPPKGRQARARLERQVARIEGVDLHNEQAYEAFEAVGAALEAFNRHCS